MKQKKLETLKIKNGNLCNRIKPCSVCGEIPSITLKRWKDPGIKGKKINFFIRCNTDRCENERKIKRTGEMLERDFLIDMLSILELEIAEWNEMVEKQQT